MRIRLFQAFASNNSGSYTIVGSFRDIDTAKDVARVLREVSAEHDTWFRENGGWSEAKEGAALSPLEQFAAEHGLHEKQSGRLDDWPEHGNPPAVLCSGREVIVFADYTITMPRAYGEYFYLRGGRVSLELEHSHDPIAVEFVFIPSESSGMLVAKEVAQKVEAFRPQLDATLVDLCKRPDYDESPPVAPAWYVDGVPRLAVLFGNVVKGVEEVTRLGQAAGFDVHVRLFETRRAADPFAALRADKDNWGLARVILWAVPDDRVQALRAVRDAAGSTLKEAQEILERLPCEIVIDVDDETARQTCECLKAAGCDAEAVTPRERDYD